MYHATCVCVRCRIFSDQLVLDLLLGVTTVELLERCLSTTLQGFDDNK